jgi:hypothetical protein
MLFTQQEISAILGLLNRTAMTPAEQLFAQSFFQRLVAFCQPPKQGEENEENTSASATDPS